MPAQMVFVYRTLLNFIGGCIPTFFTLMGLVVSAQETMRRWWPDWDTHFVRNTPTEIAFCSAFTALMALLSLWLWQGIFFGKVVLNSETITQYGLFGSRSVQWKEIQDVTSWRRLPPFSFYIIQGPSQRLHIWTGISNVQKLEAEINQRMPDTIPRIRLLPLSCDEAL